MVFFRKLIENINGDKDAQSDSNAISTLSSAYISLGIRLRLKSTRRCGICVKMVKGAHFDEVRLSIEKFLDATKETVCDLSYSIHVNNSLGYFWVIVDVKRLEDSVACIITVGEIMEQKGIPQRSIYAVFEFSKDGTEYQPYYLIYNYKLDKFYPFVPIVSRRRARNIEEEMEIMEAVKGERLPFEEDTKEWRPLWYLPF
ncbi:MAG: hypothetical protein L0H53_15740 [Candidatus Nitrosocosmicus sp.]|nr:hypothetical protein [Candidatus Nitrosocosmicus sp.]MDN5868829.1 hypothetical protein [Candidatus Nitrosocosmicus sp.]